MFTADNIMPADGPATVLKVLSTFSPTLKGKAIDIAQTCTTEFALIGAIVGEFLGRVKAWAC